jgi:very-short-patch-repair endonuclease
MWQLRELGFSAREVERRTGNGRLHRIERGVYAVGRRELTRRGRWMAAVLGGGPRAVLSHSSAAALWGIAAQQANQVDISIPSSSGQRRPGIQIHRRPHLPKTDLTIRDGIPVTKPVRTLIDIARRLDPPRLERAVNEADRLDLVDSEALFEALDDYTGQPGVGPLRELLGERTFRLTDSELERRFLCLVAEARVPAPVTGMRLNGFKVDFYWPHLALVVETDGLRYHRTPAQQARDRLRDQAHTAAGMTPLRFTHAQVRFEARYVRETLLAVVRRLEGAPGSADFNDLRRPDASKLAAR